MRPWHREGSSYEFLQDIVGRWFYFALCPWLPRDSSLNLLRCDCRLFTFCLPLSRSLLPALFSDLGFSLSGIIYILASLVKWSRVSEPWRFYQSGRSGEMVRVWAAFTGVLLRQCETDLRDCTGRRMGLISVALPSLIRRSFRCFTGSVGPPSMLW